MEKFPERKKSGSLSDAIRLAMFGAAMLGAAATTETASAETTGPDMQHEQVETSDSNKAIDAFLVEIGHLPTHSPLGKGIINSRVTMSLRLLLSTWQTSPHSPSPDSNHIEQIYSISNAPATKPLRDALLKRLAAYSDDDPRVKALRDQLNTLSTFDSKDPNNTDTEAIMTTMQPQPEIAPTQEVNKKPNKNNGVVHHGANSSTTDF